MKPGIQTLSDSQGACECEGARRCCPSRAGMTPTACPQHHRFEGEADELIGAARTQSEAITCAQIATMPKNNASEVNVAASSTTARTMTNHSRPIEQVMNIVHVMFVCQGLARRLR